MTASTFKLGRPLIEPLAHKTKPFESGHADTFFGFHPLRQYQIECAYGAEAAAAYCDDLFWAEDLFVATEPRVAGVRDVFSLCCGFGNIERHIVGQLPSVKRCVGVDVYADAVAVAQRRAQKTGLAHVMQYQVEDLSRHTWAENAYDLVIANGALMYIEEIERAIAGIHRTLRPGGIFYVHETVGAQRQQHTGRQLELINELAYMPPPEMRRFRRTNALGYLRDAFAGDLRLPRRKASWPWWARAAHPVLSAAASIRGESARENKARPPLWTGGAAWLRKGDPHNGVSSHRIVPLMKQYFPDACLRQTGGALLAYALDENFYSNYNAQDPEHVALLGRMVGFERAAMNAGEVPMEFAIMIGVK
jgi:SAM-dependent methyltransferase